MNPPTENHPPPLEVTGFVKELVSIGGVTDAGFPHLRIAWGQSREGPFASVYAMASEHHLTYRHHVKKTPLFALPIYNLAGLIVDYDVFDSSDVIPVDGRVIGRLTMREDIGIPRWFIEQAWPIDPVEWEYQRQMAVARREPDPGPCPEGALVYEEMYCLATHRGCCDREGLDQRGRRCWGEYRAPGDLDLIVLRSVETKMRTTEGWAGNEGWRNPAMARHVAQAVKAHRDEDAKQDIAEVREMEYLMASQLAPHSKRLTGDNHGLDNEKYKFVPSAYKRIRQKKQRGKHATSNADV